MTSTHATIYPDNHSFNKSTETQSINSTNMHHEQQVTSDSTKPNRIKKLPPLLVNQLAAGEVVTRPASVVKELIENAIDAGATSIDVRITQGGMGVIEVCDDGCGIHPDDMVMAVTRFATSKIADVAHLQGIATLGFRGEALAATASVSRLTLKSSADDSGVGRELNVAGILEDTPALIPVVHPRGTTVTVRDLYFNVPARRGNLKSISTEYTHIEEVVKHLALVASDVSFSLWHNEKRRFNFEAVNTNDSDYSASFMGAQSGVTRGQSAVMQSALSRLKAILPASHSTVLDDNNLQPLFIDLDGLRSQTALSSSFNDNDTNDNNDREDDNDVSLGVNGFLIPSMNSSANNAYRLIYINGRLVKDRRIAQSMRESAKALQSLGYVLFFTLPTSWLNLNVHPSKQCIKIQNLANVMAHLEVGVRSALQQWQNRQSERDERNDRAEQETQHHSNLYNPDLYKAVSQRNQASEFNGEGIKQRHPDNSSTSFPLHPLKVGEPAYQYKVSQVQKSEGNDESSTINNVDDIPQARTGLEERASELPLRCLSLIDKNDSSTIRDNIELTPTGDALLVLVQAKDELLLFQCSSFVTMINAKLAGDTSNSPLDAYHSLQTDEKNETDKVTKLDELLNTLNLWLTTLLTHYLYELDGLFEMDGLYQLGRSASEEALNQLIADLGQNAIRKLSVIDLVHQMIDNTSNDK